jgi:hypothetical protein
MTNENDKPSEQAPKDEPAAVKPVRRRIVRSSSTAPTAPREGAEGAAAQEGAAKPAEAAASAPEAAKPAPAKAAEVAKAVAPSAEAKPAPAATSAARPAGPRTIDARDPSRPHGTGAGPRGPRPGGPGRPGGGGPGRGPRPGGPRRFDAAQPRRPGAPPASWSQMQEDRPRRPGAPPASWTQVSGGRAEARGPSEGRPRSDRRPPRDARPDDRSGKPAPKPQQAQAKPAAPKANVPPPAPSQPKAAQAPRVVPLAPLPRHMPSHAKATKPAMTAKEALSAKAKAAQGTAAPKKEAAPAPAPVAETFAPELVDAGWEDAKDAIRRAGPAATALVDRWIAASNAAALAAVAEAEDIDTSARKAARRAVNVLKARGVEIPTKPKVARLLDEGPVTIEATMIPPDASGTSAFSIVKKDASGRHRLAEVIVRDSVGILHAGTAWLSGSQLREGRERARESVGVAPVAVPVEWARAKVAAAKAENATSKALLPLSYDGCKELVEPAPAAEPPHPVADLEAAITSELASARAAGSASLHEEPELRGWLPDRGALDELLMKVGERLGPEGLSDSARVDEAMSEEIAAATDRFFTPEVRAIVARRMRDAAVSVRARKGDERATDVLAVARAVTEAGLITSPPRDIPFLVAYFQKAIGWLAHQGGGSLRIPVPAQPQAAG